MTAMRGRPVEARTLINEVEGHLLIEAARAEGRAAAEQCTAHLDWLTDDQRHEIEREFVDMYVGLCRLSWQRTDLRARELRTEYEEVCRRLKRRLIAGCLAVALVATTALPILAAVWSAD
ncbi:hypothetical protein ACIP4U_36960 [Streptomyces caelestis]|jgi:hypothetical protein|uniref:Cytochrome C oxidase subunit I n=1 Tax=Streptomyces caelestis TaxID=36816 RepID=A0A7W9GZ50_9ACTN|nr:hypothetical protein [Streptomyces caelestis]MBB5792694.1 hypothetical protein [Streptomyces caelestis]GGW86967.1 hypothetical protein GCM10010320_80640 [Streptomyces caelestis]